MDDEDLHLWSFSPVCEVTFSNSCRIPAMYSSRRLLGCAIPRCELYIVAEVFSVCDWVWLLNSPFSGFDGCFSGTSLQARSKAEFGPD